jgi:SM-20-related protein
LTDDTTVLVRERRIDGQPLYIIDGLFQPGLVRMLHELFNKLTFQLSDYDTEDTKDVRHWKHEFALESLTAHPLLRSWHDVIVARTCELFRGTAIELVRVHCNNQPYGDLQLPHRDLVPGVTALYFANAEWQDAWQGEVVLYDCDGEPFHVVAPKPGRLLIFSGDVLHRGGVPSRACLQARLSVAFKFGAKA